MKKRCVYIGGKQIGADCLRILLNAGVRPELVIVNLDDTGEDTWYESVAKIAKEENLRLLSGKKIKDEKVIKMLKKTNPEIIFNIGGMQMIPIEVLSIPQKGCINLHPALLPRYRGRYSTSHAIFNGEKYNGITLHVMDEGIDSGPIILQDKVKIEEDDTAKSLYEKVFTHAGKQLFKKFVDKWVKGEETTPTPQDESKALYYPKGLPNNGVLNWSWSGKKIKRFIRAMTFEPFPPAEFKIGKKEMVVIDKKYFKGFN